MPPERRRLRSLAYNLMRRASRKTTVCRIMFGPTGQRERQLAQGYARLTGRDADASHPHFHRGNQRVHVQDVQGVGGQVQVRDDMAVAVKDKFNLAPSVPCGAATRKHCNAHHGYGRILERLRSRTPYLTPQHMRNRAPLGQRSA